MTFAARVAQAQLLDEVELSAAAADITFTDIDQGYRHLLALCVLRSDRANVNDFLRVRFGGPSAIDSGANYNELVTQVTGGGTSQGAQNGAQTGVGGLPLAGGNANAGVFTVVEVFIPLYSRTGYRHQVLASGGSRNSGTAGESLNGTMSGDWTNTTDAIHRLRCLTTSGSNWVAGSAISLFGLGA